MPSLYCRCKAAVERQHTTNVGRALLPVTIRTGRSARLTGLICTAQAMTYVSITGLQQTNLSAKCAYHENVDTRSYIRRRALGIFDRHRATVRPIHSNHRQRPTANRHQIAGHPLPALSARPLLRQHGSSPPSPPSPRDRRTRPAKPAVVVMSLDFCWNVLD